MQLWRLTRRFLFYSLLGLAFAALGVVAYDRLVRIAWIGPTHLSLEFVVTDEATGQPIDGAVLVVHGESERDLGGGDRTITLTADQSGVLRYEIPNGTCVGRDSGLGFTRSRSVYAPHWIILPSAPGYQEADPVYLHEYRGRIEQTGRRQDRLVVPISLRKVAR